MDFYRKNKVFRMKRRTFTLIELLVVIGIIGLLAAMLMPALDKARAKAKQTQCANQLRQIASMGFAMYQSDNRGKFPYWSSQLFNNYINTKKAYLCPMDGNSKRKHTAESWEQHPDSRFKASFDRKGNKGIHQDPNADVEKISYFYEMSDARCTFSWGNSSSELPNATWAEVKEYQLEWGPNSSSQGDPFDPTVFPVYRCFWHTKQPWNKPGNQNAPVLNISYAGNLFLSMQEWEKGVWIP